jgi:hypothetical protein
MNELQDLKKNASVYPNVSSMKIPHGYEGNFEIGCQEFTSVHNDELL